MDDLQRAREVIRRLIDRIDETLGETDEDPFTEELRCMAEREIALLRETERESDPLVLTRRIRKE